MKKNMKGMIGVGGLVIVAVVAIMKFGGGIHPMGSGGVETPVAGDQCTHGASKKLCFLCDPALREKGRLWCSEHSRYEDRCWLCHPELEDKKRLWCKEHSLYEDECFLCHPELKNTGAAGASGETSTRISELGSVASAPRSSVEKVTKSGPKVLMCTEHDMMESECGICHPDMIASLKPGQSAKVRLPHVESAKLVGIRTTKPVLGGVAGGVECYAELMFDQNKFSEIPAPIGGVVKEVLVDLGMKVAERQVLARMWSAQVTETVAKAVLSHQVLKRESELHAKGITSTKDLQEAQASHRTICQQARALGFSEEEVEKMVSKPEDQVLLDVRAPFAGEIVERRAIRGALIEAGKSLFTVADRLVMWAMLSVPESALPHLNTGQTVEIRVDAVPGRTFIGDLTWIAADVDEKSRLGRARVEISNPDGVLRARMFGRARIMTPRSGRGMLIPMGAIQHVENETIAFVKVTEDLYEARKVRLGTHYGTHVEVLEGLKSGEPVVWAQSFTLKSQLLSSRLGKGCVD